MQRSFFFSKNGPVDPYGKKFLVKDHIPTHTGKLITFHIQPGLFQMYVLAAVGGSEFDSTWYVWTSRTFSRTRAVFSRVWNAPWLAHILMKTAWNLKLGIFSTQKGLKLAHQEHFKHTAHACRNIRKVHTLLIGINPRFTGTAQTDPPEKFP